MSQRSFPMERNHLPRLPEEIPHSQGRVEMLGFPAPPARATKRVNPLWRAKRIAFERAALASPLPRCSGCTQNPTSAESDVTSNSTRLPAKLSVAGSPMARTARSPRASPLLTSPWISSEKRKLPCTQVREGEHTSSLKGLRFPRRMHAHRLNASAVARPENYVEAEDWDPT